MPESAACEVTWDAPEPVAGKTCGEDAIGTFSIGCAAEHVDRTRVCCGCAADVQQQHAGITPECGTCGRPALAVIRWDEGYRYPEPVTAVGETPHA